MAPQVTAAPYVIPNTRPLHARCWRPAGSERGAIGLVHGLGEHLGRYDWLATRLAEAGYEVAAFDQWGHGLDPHLRGDAPSYDHLLDDVASLVAALRRTAQRPVYLYGHSLGANLVVSLVLRRGPPLSGLILSSPLFLPARPIPRWKNAAGRALARVRPTFGFNTGIVSEDLSHDPDAVARHRSDPLIHRRVSARLAVAMVDAGEDALRRAAELRLPTLLMHGTADAVTACEASEQFAARAGTNCTLRLWSDLFHELHWESEREEVVQSVLDWLSRQGNH